MGYDALDRLTSVTSPMFTAAHYGYDVLDNLTTVQVTGGNQPRNHTYVYTNQRLTQVKQTVGGAVVSALGYDVRGNVAVSSPSSRYFKSRASGVALRLRLPSPAPCASQAGPASARAVSGPRSATA